MNASLGPLQRPAESRSAKKQRRVGQDRPRQPQLSDARALRSLLLRVRSAADAVASGKYTSASVSAPQRIACHGQGADQLQLVRERGWREGALGRLLLRQLVPQLQGRHARLQAVGARVRVRVHRANPNPTPNPNPNPNPFRDPMEQL